MPATTMRTITHPSPLIFIGADNAFSFPPKRDDTEVESWDTPGPLVVGIPVAVALQDLQLSCKMYINMDYACLSIQCKLGNC